MLTSPLNKGIQGEVCGDNAWKCFAWLVLQWHICFNGTSASMANPIDSNNGPGVQSHPTQANPRSIVTHEYETLAWFLPRVT